MKYFFIPIKKAMTQLYLLGFHCNLLHCLYVYDLLHTANTSLYYQYVYVLFRRGPGTVTVFLETKVNIAIEMSQKLPDD
jgi:hypothetical protein